MKLPKCFILVFIFAAFLLLIPAQGLAQAYVEDIEWQIFQKVNYERTSRGLPALQMDSKLRDIARGHSKDMGDNGFFNHVSPTTGFGAQQRLEQNSINWHPGFGENIAANDHPASNTAAVAVQGWMNSTTGHRETILDVDKDTGQRMYFNYTGIGVYRTSDGKYYYTQKFLRATSPPSTVLQPPSAGEQRPAAPNLLSPGNNANVAGSSVTFQWNAVSGANKYFLSITRVSDGAQIFHQEVGNVTSYPRSGFASDGAQYRWRVWAGNSAGWSANSSATWSFTNGTATTTPTRDYLAGSFASGTFRYNSGPNNWDWTISRGPARALAYTDMTGNGTLNLVASWDGWGTGYYEGGRWVRLTTSVARAMASNGIQLAVSVPSGTYIYDPPHQRWILRSTTPANAVASIKMAEDGYSSHLVASFPGSGVFYWSNGQWIRFAQNSAVAMGGSGQWLYISLPSGTFMYNHLENPNQWTRITTSVATAIGVAGMVDDGYFNAVCSFPSGTYYREWTGTGQRWHYLASPALALAGYSPYVQRTSNLVNQGLIDIE